MKMRKWGLFGKSLKKTLDDWHFFCISIVEGKFQMACLR